MKILKKRKIAFVIDSFIFGFIIAGLQLIIEDLTVDRSIVFFALMFSPLFLRDYLFKGASIGKKILGIRIYNDDWKSPTFLKLLKRSFLTTSYGWMLWWKSKFIEECFSDIIEWEREKFGTRVVDNKVFKRLSEKAKLCEGRWEDNMSKIYDEYIMCVYFK